MTNNQQKLSSKISAYFIDKKEVAAVYLFGSHARNHASPQSDVDLAILLDPYDSLQAEKLCTRLMIELGRILRSVIHPVIMNSASEELLRQILSKGICVHINNNDVLSRFKMRALTMIAEFGYYRKILQSGLVKSIMEAGRD